MGVTFEAVSPTAVNNKEKPTVVGYEVRGVDVEAGVDDELFEQLRERLNSAGMLLFRDQNLSEEGQAAFAAKLGPWHQSGVSADEAGNKRPVQYFDSTKGGAGTGELLFHTDSAFRIHPPRYLMLFGIKVSRRGGETLYASNAEAVERMPQHLVDELRRCEVVNASFFSPENRAQVPAISEHWASGRPYLNVNRSVSREIVGAASPERAEELRQLAFAYVYDIPAIYRHSWSEGDFIVWDNLLLQHSREPFDESEHRLMRRCAIADPADPEAIEPAALSAA